MDTRSKRAARRIAAALLLAGGLGGCVYAPPYAAYDPYYYGYSYPAYAYPTYVGPPLTLDFGFYHFGHGGYGGWHGGGWRGHGGGWGHGWGGRH
jgi:hypothetical protein